MKLVVIGGIGCFLRTFFNCSILSKHGGSSPPGGNSAFSFICIIRNFSVTFHTFATATASISFFARGILCLAVSLVAFSSCVTRNSNCIFTCAFATVAAGVGCLAGCLVCLASHSCCSGGGCCGCCCCLCSGWGEDDVQRVGDGDAGGGERHADGEEEHRLHAAASVEAVAAEYLSPFIGRLHLYSIIHLLFMKIEIAHNFCIVDAVFKAFVT